MFTRLESIRSWSPSAGAVTFAMLTAIAPTLAGATPVLAQDTQCSPGCVGAVEAALEWAAADLDRLAAELAIEAAPPVVLAAEDRSKVTRRGSLDATALRSVAAEASTRWNTAPESIGAYIQAMEACADDASTPRCVEAADQSAVGIWRVRPVSDDAFRVEAWVEVISPEAGKIGAVHGRGATLEIARRGDEWVVSDVLWRIVSQQ